MNDNFTLLQRYFCDFDGAIMQKTVTVFLLFFLPISLYSQWEEIQSPFGASISKIHFFDKNNGIIVTSDLVTGNHIIYQTYNSGATWDSISNAPPYVTYPINYFIYDSLKYFAVDFTEIYKTENNGLSWDKLNIPFDNIIYTTVYFQTDSLGFIGGSNEQILKTTDAGVSWTKVFSYNAGASISSFTFHNNVGFAYTQSLIFKTSDNGDTWTKLDLPVANPSIHSLICFDEESIIAMINNEIYSSSNGGETWVHTFTFSRNQGMMAFANDSIGFVIGGTIYKTTNSGKDWFAQSDPSVSSNYSNLFILNENYGWISHNWDLLKTENGGGERFHSFNIDYPNTGDTLYALTEIRIKWSGFSSRRDLNIKFSSDDGQTWINLATNFNSENNFYWNVPNTPSDQCKILIENNENISEWEETENFTIAPPPPLIITDPARNGFYSLSAGHYFNISWLAFNVDKIKIEFSPDSGVTWQTIVSSYPADSLKYRWRVPFVSSNKCLIKITSIDNPPIYALTNIYFIIHLPTLSITYPDENSIFNTGDIELLQIAGDYDGAMKLELTTDNGRYWLFIDSLNSSDWGSSWNRSYEWSVPDLYSDSCRFKLTVYETDSFIGVSSIFRINNNPSIKRLIANAKPGDTIYITESEYVECVVIDKPITLIGKGINETKITGDTLKPVIVIRSDNVEIKNLSVIAKTKSDGIFQDCSNYKPTNGMEILNSSNIVLDSLQVIGGKDISGTGHISGGSGLFVQNTANVYIINSKIIGADGDENIQYTCGGNGGDGLKIYNSDSFFVSDCYLYGGKGGDGARFGGFGSIPGLGGHSLSLYHSYKVQVTDSYLKGGIGGKTTPSTPGRGIQAKAGDGAYCDSTNAVFFNSILEGGMALINLPPYNVALNTLGGNGITVVNYSDVVVDGGTLIRGVSSDDAMGKLYYTDSTSSINFTNIIVNTTVYNLSCTLKNSSVKLVWDAEIGLNFMQFEIERKPDEKDWTTIEIITDTTQSISYTDTIFTTPSRSLKYRIKIVNLDSTFSYSETQEIDFLPTVYRLYQNYPNPFNPATTIEYSIPEKSNVTIKVFDLLGREVVTLVNKEKPVGLYEVKFDGSRFASGVYFYRIEAGKFSETKKFVLLK